MKLVYMCHTGFKNGGPWLRDPLLKMGAFRAALTGNTRDLGAKNNKEMYIIVAPALAWVT